MVRRGGGPQVLLCRLDAGSCSRCLVTAPYATLQQSANCCWRDLALACIQLFQGRKHSTVIPDSVRILSPYSHALGAVRRPENMRY